MSHLTLDNFEIRNSTAKQVLALKHRLSSFSKGIAKIVGDNKEGQKLIGLMFRSLDQSITDLFYRDQLDKVEEALGIQYKLSKDDLERIRIGLYKVGIITHKDEPIIPISRENEKVNYYRVMRELCEDVEKELEEKLRKEGKR